MQMSRIWLVMLMLIVLAAVMLVAMRGAPPRANRGEEHVKGGVVFLPLPRLKSEVTVEEAIASRRSIRRYLEKPLTLDQLSQLLWAAQGITEVNRGFRAAPSAGATYPLVIYVVVGEDGVGGLDPGVYRYDPHAHVLVLVRHGDHRAELASACLNQPWVREAPVSIVITAVYERTTHRYGERGVRYVHIEVGHVGQNIYLQATALGLGTVAVGAFEDERVHEVIGAAKGERPLYVMPVGVPQRTHKLALSDLEEYITRHRKAYGEG